MKTLIIAATLGGNKLETDLVDASSSIVFENNLIWETDKKSIKKKKMKTENLPIKMECYNVKQFQGKDIRSLIGYVLLPIRSVPLVPPNKPINVTTH